jgi:hypothetical protein
MRVGSWGRVRKLHIVDNAPSSTTRRKAVTKMRLKNRKDDTGLDAVTPESLRIRTLVREVWSSVPSTQSRSARSGRQLLECPSADR